MPQHRFIEKQCRHGIEDQRECTDLIRQLLQRKGAATFSFAPRKAESGNLPRRYSDYLCVSSMYVTPLLLLR